MRRFFSLLALVMFVALDLGGCPTSTGDNSQTAGSGLSAGDLFSDSASPADRPDELTLAFPECNEPLSVDAWRARVLELVNEARTSRGLSALTYSQQLESQATQYACEMIGYDFFAHENPVTGSTLRERAEQFQYDFQIIGENLAAGQPTPEEAMDDWMNSAGHRENILNREFVELGIGIRTGGTYGTYWVQEFGRPRQVSIIEVPGDTEEMVGR
ncbi:Cysteine-rich secretory protein family protein [Phycisphaerae bacterium RAS1]|nr:Cysteine-rich secretory protein family protein [Phycisphaerae bacterium RAS1]